MYQKTGGKSGRHAHVDQVNKIVSVSNLAVQLYQAKGVGSSLWNPLVRRGEQYSTPMKLFAILPSRAILWAYTGSNSWPTRNGSVFMNQSACDITSNIWDSLPAITKICENLSAKPVADDDE